MWLFIAFLTIPLIEIALFITIGGAIGLVPTLLIVVLTAIAGTMLVRSQGQLALANLRSSFSDLKDPTEPLVHGAMILFSGALLLTPGFFTDAVGFALLVPAFRSWLFKEIRKRVHVQSMSMGTAGGFGERRSPQDDIIEGSYEPASEERPGPKQPSGWSRH
ncbi:MAG: FxsA family protein [Pseudomonadota bacterium]